MCWWCFFLFCFPHVIADFKGHVCRVQIDLGKRRFSFCKKDLQKGNICLEFVPPLQHSLDSVTRASPDCIRRVLLHGTPGVSFLELELADDSFFWTVEKKMQTLELVVDVWSGGVTPRYFSSDSVKENHARHLVLFPFERKEYLDIFGPFFVFNHISESEKKTGIASFSGFKGRVKRFSSVVRFRSCSF